MGKVVLVACTNVGRAIIDAIYNSDKLKDVELTGVVNLKPEAAIEKANYDSYIDLVKKYNLNIYYCENINEPECILFLEQCRPDVIIQSGWSQKFSQEVLNIPVYACIGEHPAPLPKGRGAACVNWAIITGEREWGDSFFHMEMQYDTGVIYSQEKFNIEIYDDVKTVYDKVAAAAVRAVEKNLVLWSRGILNGKKQDDALSTHYKRRRPSDGEFNFSQDSVSIYNQIRGQAKPYPGAFFYANVNGLKKKIYVWKASLTSSLINNKLINTEEYLTCGVKVLCGDGKVLILLRVQPENEPECWASDSDILLKYAKDINIYLD